MVKVATVIFLTITALVGLRSGSIATDKPPAPQLTIELSKTRVVEWCQKEPSRTGGVCSKEQAKVRVTVKTNEQKSDALTYYYVPTCGSFDGNGSEVSWDLSNCSRGTYAVTVALGVERVLNDETASASVEVLECPHCGMICNCPIISVSAPDKTIRPGQAFVLDANVGGGDLLKFAKYQWSISEGVILAGERSTRCFVRSDKNKKNYMINATFRIDGLDPACNCTTSWSETIFVKEK
jgi:hypothetical protein